MLDIVRLPRVDGSLKSYYRLNSEHQQRYPLFLVLPMPEALGMLERIREMEDFPTMDVDAILQVGIDAMFHKTKNRDRHHVLREVIREILMDTVSVYHDGFVIQQELELALFMVLQACYDTLNRYGVYDLDGVLPYDYLHRRGKHAIVLQRRDLIPLD